MEFDKPTYMALLLWLFVPRHDATEANVAIYTRDEQELKDAYYLFSPIETYTRRECEDTHFVYLLKGSACVIDKSLFIKRFWEIKEKVVFITSPPKTGKSCNLHMLKAFFEIRTKKTNATLIPRQQSSMYRFFTTGALNTSDDSPLQFMRWYTFSVLPEFLTITATFESAPMISRHRDFIDEHLGRYPVIFLRFTSLFIEENNLTNHLFDKVCEVYTKHHFLNEWMEEFMRSDTVTDQQKEEARPRFEKFWHYFNQCFYFKLNATELVNSIVTLSQFMFEQFGEQVIILTDFHLDTVLWHQWDTDYYRNPQRIALNVRRGIPLLRRFMKRTFFENPYLKKALLTGTLAVDKTTLFDDHPDLVHYNALYNDLQEFYGFTESEVKLLFEYLAPPTELNDIDDELAEQAHRFFNGYTLWPNLSLNIYNMYSIVFLCDRMKIHEFWINHKETFDKMEIYAAEHGRLGDLLKCLIGRNETSIRYEDTDFHIKDTILDRNASYTVRDVYRVMSFLCEMGVLTNSRTDRRVRKREKGQPWNVTVRIPNNEVRRGIEAILWPEMHPNRQCILGKEE